MKTTFPQVAYELTLDTVAPIGYEWTTKTSLTEETVVWRVSTVTTSRKLPDGRIKSFGMADCINIGDKFQGKPHSDVNERKNMVKAFQAVISPFGEDAADVNVRMEIVRLTKIAERLGYTRKPDPNMKRAFRIWDAGESILTIYTNGDRVYLSYDEAMLLEGKEREAYYKEQDEWARMEQEAERRNEQALYGPW